MDGSRAEQLFSDALALPLEERIEFVTGACRGDPALRAELISLLEHAEPAEAFFESLAQAVIPDLPPPALQAGRYEILECIGVGGMGAVYRARDARLERDVALKFMPARREVPDDDNRLLHEARAAAALEHPNICTIYEIAETADGRPFIAMTLYDGETLRERLVRGPLGEREALDIAIQAARGLVTAHAHDVVHRDVKPGNIMITSAGIVKLLDFGLATRAHSPVHEGALPGTVPYMSPEQLRGETPGPQSDLWSLGVVMYEMLAGRRPFAGGDAAACRSSVLNDAPDPLRGGNMQVSSVLERIVTRLLERDTSARYQTADELLRDLLREQASRNGASGWLPASRRARAVAFVAAAALLLGGVSAWQQVAGGRHVARSIAVLPFRQADDDSSQRFLADGLRDELTATLSRLQGLHVIGQRSVARYESEPRDLQEIGKALQVRSVLTGTVRAMGDSIQLRAELYDTGDGRLVWEDSYQMPVSRIARLHNDIASGVSDALGVRISAPERANLAERAAMSSNAYTSWLRGRYFWHQRTAISYARAIEQFQLAIREDSLFAPAYAGLASVYTQQGMAGQLPIPEAAEKARAAALRAVALDGNSAEAHSALALYLHAYAWDSEMAEREFIRALELDPDQPLTHHYYSTFLRSLRRLDEAVAHGSRAVALDPLVPGYSETLALTLLRAGQPEAAQERIRQALELDSTYWRAHAVLGAIAESTNRPEDAIRAYRRANELAGAVAHRTTADRARVLARTGARSEARQLSDSLWAVAARSGAYEAAAATVFHALGDDSIAFYWLETAFRQKQPHLRYLDGDPRYESLARDSRFAALMQRVGVRR